MKYSLSTRDCPRAQAYFTIYANLSCITDWVNPSKRVGMDGVFLGLAGLLLGISLGLRPREIPQSSPVSPWKTPSIPPLLLGITYYIAQEPGRPHPGAGKSRLPK